MNNREWQNNITSSKLIALLLHYISSTLQASILFIFSNYFILITAPIIHYSSLFSHCWMPLHIFKNPLQWFVRHLKQTFKKKKLSFKNIPYKFAFRHTNSTQKDSLSENSKMLVSKNTGNQDENQQNIKSEFAHCHPLPSFQHRMLT